MAKQKRTAVVEPPPLSVLARYMLSFHGRCRLAMIRDEHEAGLPPKMPVAERLAKIAAIDEILGKKPTT